MVYPDKLQKFYSRLETMCRESGVIAGGTGRHMKYPYTFSAKMAQFPIFFYMKNNMIWMYYPLGCAVAFYCIWGIHNVVNSEENKRTWAETQRRIAEKEAHH